MLNETRMALRERSGVTPARWCCRAPQNLDVLSTTPLHLELTAKAAPQGEAAGGETAGEGMNDDADYVPPALG